MAFDAIMNFPVPSLGTGLWPKGESEEYEDGFALTDSWAFSLENKLNITQHTSGAGAGKAQFEAFTIKKQIDASSAQLFMACGAGAHFQGVTVSLYKSGGTIHNAKDNLFVRWTFNQLAVEKIEWSHDEIAPQENVTFKFGSCGIIYGKQSSSTGIIKKENEGTWNQVSNQMDIKMGILGAVEAKWL